MNTIFLNTQSILFNEKTQKRISFSVEKALSRNPCKRIILPKLLFPKITFATIKFLML